MALFEIEVYLQAVKGREPTSWEPPGANGPVPSWTPALVRVHEPVIGSLSEKTSSGAVKSQRKANLGF